MNEPFQPRVPVDVFYSRRRIGVVEERSKLLFGSYYFVAVAVAIAQGDGVVNATDLSWQLQITNPQVRRHLKAMAEAGLLTESPGSSEDRKRWFVRCESALWQLVVELQEDWTK